MSFNAFLSTGMDESMSRRFAQHSLNNPQMVGVLFHLDIDPSISSIPFAFISDAGCFQNDNEVLFSMNSVFRIQKVKQMEEHDRLFEVYLTSVSDEDQKLNVLERVIHKEIEGAKGWHSLGKLALYLGQYDDAEEIFQMLLGQTSDANEKSIFYHQLGMVRDGKGEYAKAIQLYEQTLKIREKFHSSTHPDLAQCYYSIGSSYNQLGKYFQALSFQEKALDISQKFLPPNHPDICQSYNNIGAIYYNMGEYSKALSYLEKALTIGQTTFPDIHPTLAEIYKNSGLTYHKMKQSAKAISFCERAVDIGQCSLPVNHPKLQLWKNTLEIVRKG